MNAIKIFWSTYFDFQYCAAFCVGAVLFVFISSILFREQRKKRINRTPWHIIYALLFSVYMTFLLGVTLMNRKPEQSYRLELQLFWSYLETIRDGNTGLGKQILYNILAFVPFGILVPMTFGRMRKASRVILVAVLLSAMIEITQLVFKCGLCELDDVINNTLGAGLGYAIWSQTPLRKAPESSQRVTKVPDTANTR